MIVIGMTDYDKAAAKDIYESVISHPTKPIITDTFDADYWDAVDKVCNNLDDVIEPLKNKIEDSISDIVSKYDYDAIPDFGIWSLLNKHFINFNDLQTDLRITCKWKDDINIHFAIARFAKCKFEHDILELTKSRLYEKLSKDYFS